MIQERIDPTIERVQQYLAARGQRANLHPELIHSIGVDPDGVVIHNLRVSDLEALCAHTARVWQLTDAVVAEQDEQIRVMKAQLAVAMEKPRVFFNGDTVPAGVRVMDRNGDMHPEADEIEEEWDSYLGPVVEVLLDYDAEVARARKEKINE